MMRVLIIATLVCHASAALFGRNNKQALREFRGAELSCAAFGGAAGYVTAGNLYKTSVPPGMAYRSIRLPLLTPSQRLAVALAAAAGGTAAARAAYDSDSLVGDLVRSVGRASAGVGDSVDNLFAAPRRWAAKRREDREREAQKEWLRTHTQAAKIYIPEK